MLTDFLIALQRFLAIALLLAALITAGQTNGSPNTPFNPEGAFAAIMMVLISIAISVIR